MNIAAARWVVLLTLAVAAAIAAPADTDYEEYEDDAPPAAPVKPVRPSPLLRQARGPAIGRPAPKAAATPKPTTEAQPAVEYEDEEFDEEAPAEESVTTTTEAPKKGGLRTGVVRPFRSNADLIEALKRRRQQQGSGSSSASSAPSTTSAAPTTSSDKSYKPGRRGGNKGGSAPADQTGSNSERQPTVNSSSRRFSTRGRTTEAPAEPEVEEQQPVRSRTFSGARSRRF